MLLILCCLDALAETSVFDIQLDKDVSGQILANNSDTLSAEQLLNLANESYQKDTSLSNNYGARALNSSFAMENMNFRIRAYINLGHNRNKQGDLHVGLDYLEKGLTLSEELGDKNLQAKAHNYLGIFYNDRGNNVLAADHYIRSLKLAQEVGDTLGMIKPHNNLAGIFLEQNRPEKAREYAEVGLELCIAFKERMGEGLLRNNLAQAFLALDQPLKAREQLEQSLIISTERNDTERIARNHSNLCVCNRLLGDLSKAGYHCDKASKLLNTINDPRSNMLHAIQYGLYYLESDDISNAEAYARKALDIGQSESLSMHMADAYDLMHKINKQNGNYKKALNDHEAYVDIKYGDKSNNAKIATIEDNYRQLLMDAAKIKNEAQLGQLQIESVTSTSQRNYAMGLAVILGCIVLLVYSGYHSKNTLSKVLIEKNTEIEAQNIIIEKALSEKETLLKEIHHRVKNNLQIVSSLLNLQSRKVDDEAVLASINEGQNRVQAMSLIHQALYQSDDVTTVAMQAYLEKLIEHLSYSFGFEQKKINYTIRANEINFDIDTAVPVGLMVNELVSNSYKHAFENREEGNILISIKKTGDGKIKLAVKDNGIGIPEDVNINKPSGLGLKLIKTLGIKQLKGAVSIDGSSGTDISLIFEEIDKVEVV